MKKVLLYASQVLLFAAVSSQPAAADPIPVSGVFFAQTINAGPPPTAVVRYELSGAGGFSLLGSLSSTTGAFAALTCLTCTVGPGGRLQTASGFLGGGPVESLTLDGVTYGPSEARFGDIWTSLVSIPFPLPATGAQGTFDVTGTFSWHGVVFRNALPGVELGLVGNGTTTLTFAPESTPGSIRLVGARFDFATPTPEPATLGLLGLGAAVVASRRRQRSARS